MLDSNSTNLLPNTTEAMVSCSVSSSSKFYGWAPTHSATFGWLAGLRETKNMKMDKTSQKTTTISKFTLELVFSTELLLSSEP